MKRKNEEAKLLSLILPKKGRFGGLFLCIKTTVLLLLSWLVSISAYATPQPTLVELPYSTFTCGNSKQAINLANLIVNDENQQRTHIRCNPTLVAIAEEKVNDMAQRGFVSHFLGGSPNTRLRNAGLTLPSYYGSAMSNQVEALAGGYSTAKKVWHGLKSSYSHKQHLLGEIPFYVEQNEIGVAFIKDIKTPHVEYWAIYITKLNSQTNSTLFTEIPDKGLGIVTEGGEITEGGDN
ncbi:CAP domain-containing protein [Alteromonas sp. 1_MG-2023]|uniref:CAP domain-containing protein n=1 Tax=Alteromonas sp. 1_MG-2023 TaxID=3062669 RepID=UPI0026E26935|nr:CAP domain-containing protein [Alteromonas sp. 1_MG-2023]MDO6569123.1 CAP domain-containing protein [Alteromonas sp. 1_MG-2023]